MKKFGLALIFLISLASAFNIDSESITVSGVSSGAFMAVQYHVAHSKVVTGAAVISGGPYYCANFDVAVALESCMTKPELIAVSELHAATTFAETSLTIDSTSNMINDKLYLVHGDMDNVVYKGVVDKVVEYYKKYLPKQNIKYDTYPGMMHGWPTVDYGVNCSVLESPYIVKCGVDTAKNILDHLLGIELTKYSEPLNDSYVKINQKSYFPPGATPGLISMGEIAYAYVPATCRSGEQCKLHVALHGCEMAMEKIGMDFIKHSGLNRWAEANNIVILYPQIKENTLNPKGCWDWWGYTGADYATKIAAQILTVENMVKSLIQ